MIPLRELSRAAAVLFVRGFLLVMLASVAVRWPEETLITAVGTAGLVLAALGLIEIPVAIVSHVRGSTRTLMLAHAILSIAFGAVGTAASVASVEMTVAASTIWLLLQAVFALGLLHVTPQPGLSRLPVFGWVAVNVVLAMLVMTYRRNSIAPLLYAGTLYAWAYGAVQIGVALWIRRHVRLVASLR
jgi:hypothetical protein